EDFLLRNPGEQGGDRGVVFTTPPSPGSPTLSQSQAGESPRRKQVGGWVGVLPCPFPVLTSLHLGLTADKDEGDHPNNSFSPCSAHDRRCLQKHLAKIRDRSTSGGKMKVIGVPREEARPVPQGSCQSELHRALERLAASQSRTHEDLYIIPIPNCDRNGNFHPKQCHPALDGQRGKCWCVDRKTGVKLPGGLEPKGELDCHQLADSFRE
ncbi:insulin-like growth factor-binding protein 4, partial [Panthera uncia]|uniref:insulin-like growth factor-binding protein 4 n=1 Tax=Panthera uncia TaxID=29064 RepID=UPI0020FFDD4F